MASMNLLALRTEVLAHGFDPIGFGSSRINQYLNDAQALFCRRVDYYVDESTQDYSTVSGTSLYSLPTDFAKVRSLRRTDIGLELQSVGLRDIDSSTITSGTPYAYAMDAANVHLYPTPDNAYPLELRYWKQPADLVADTDFSPIPAAWQRALWYWAVREAFAAEDDPQTAQYWEGQFNTVVAEAAADLKFPNDDMPNQMRSMWSGRGLNQKGWTIAGFEG